MSALVFRQAAEIVFDLQLVFRQEILAGQLERLLAIVPLQPHAGPLFLHPLTGPARRRGANLLRRTDLGSAFLDGRGWILRGPFLVLPLLIAARGPATLGTVAAAGSPFLRPLDQFVEVGDDLPLQTLRHRAGIAMVDPLLNLAHRFVDLQQRVLRFAFLLGRGAKFLLQLLLHLLIAPSLALGPGRIAQQFAIVVVARLGTQAVAELIVGRGRRTGKGESACRRIRRN